MRAAPSSVQDDAALVEAVQTRMVEDLGSILGHAVYLEAAGIERVQARPAGQGSVHISFKLAFHAQSGARLHGALLVPLADAITMACFLLMIPEESVKGRRTETALDATLKDALLEIGNLLGGATNSALGDLGLAGWSARSEGCQGVRAGVRPAFPYEEGSPLVVARVRAVLEAFPPVEFLLVLPPLP